MSNVFTAPEFLYAVVDTSDNSTTVYSGKVLVRGVYVNTSLSAHTVILKNDSTAVFTIPSSTGAGTFIPFGDVSFDTSLVVDPDDSSTGSITVIYKPYV